MTVINVEGMHCEKCVERIEKAMNEAGLDYKVSLADKTVEIDGCEKRYCGSNLHHVYVLYRKDRGSSGNRNCP